MKTWILYLASLLMAFSTTLIFGDSATALSIFQTLSSFVLQIGSLIYIPLLFIGVASGIASLRRDSLTSKVHTSAIFWILFTSIILPLIAVSIFYFYPTKFPVSSTAGSQSIQESIFAVASSSSISALSGNPFYTFAVSSTFLLPILVLAWLFGYALKPNVDVIKPAYAVFNSLSEVMFRISHYFSVFGYFLVYILATKFFLSLYNEKTIFVSPIFIITILAIVVAIVLIILPLIYLIITRHNPYKLLYRTLAVSIASLVGANANFTSPLIESISRHNLGVQKRISASLTPLFAIFSKAGSATMASIALASIIYATTGELPTFKILAIIALLSSLSAFASSSAMGFEISFILFSVMKLGNITLYGAEMTLFGLVPLFLGLGYLIDTEITLMGLSIASIKSKTNCPTLYNDIL